MTNKKLDELLTGEEPKEINGGSKGFDPKFNVREEFAMWVREQFPQLKEYAKKRRVYQELEARKDEVYHAALGAVNHGVTSTEACASSRLQSGWYAFERMFKTENPRIRARGLEILISALEDLSISLGGNRHFTEAGKFLNGSSYSGNLGAFVYVSKENGENKYLVFDSRQEFAGDNVPVLIGEFMNLTKWKLEDLQKIAADFKGPEEQFIEEVDRRVPEDGTYSYPTYYGSGSFGYGGTSYSSQYEEGGFFHGQQIPGTTHAQPTSLKYPTGKSVKVTGGPYNGTKGRIVEGGDVAPRVKLDGGNTVLLFGGEFEIIDEVQSQQNSRASEGSE